ncbi:MAG: polyphosphate polymerase domain-containing protein [bacterium]|nr:polyphosphate polymerase domain-containing protein [bacterium]
METKKPLTFRHELKFLISEEEKEAIISRLSCLMQCDRHAKNGIYQIRSLYFDDQNESAYVDKLSGTSSRKKYRIRNYNFSDEVIRLERKRKEDAYINKVSVLLSKEETLQLMEGKFDFLLERDEPLCKDFYVECVINHMRPKVIVDYDREPYVYAAGDVRITFDSHIRAGVFKEDMFDPNLPTIEVLEPGQLIMEVKYTEFLPYVIRDLLPTADSAYMAASKYVMCLEKRKEFM